MVQRRIPRPRDLAPLLRFKRWEPNAKKRRLAQALTIDDLRLIAKRRTPQAPFDYTDGAAEAELSLSRARRAFQNIEFHPNILRDVSRVETSRMVLGAPSEFPLAIAPTGFTRMMHTEGEVGVTRMSIGGGDSSAREVMRHGTLLDNHRGITARAGVTLLPLYSPGRLRSLTLWRVRSRPSLVQSGRRRPPPTLRHAPWRRERWERSPPTPEPNQFPEPATARPRRYPETVAHR
jgi:hypothetical protein